MSARENANDAQHTPSEQQWLRVNAYLHRNRYELAVRAADDFPSGARVAGTPLIAAAGVTDFVAAEYGHGEDLARTRSLLKTLAAAS